MVAAAGARGGWYADRGFTKSYKVGPDDHPAGSLSSETKCSATGDFFAPRLCMAWDVCLTAGFQQVLMLPAPRFADCGDRHRWAFTLYQPFAMSASMGSAMGEMESMAIEDMAMDSMAAGWSFAGLLDDRFQETTQLHLGLSIHGMRPFRTSHMIRTLETLD